jgi:hypothetical protein
MFFDGLTFKFTIACNPNDSEGNLNCDAAREWSGVWL